MFSGISQDTATLNPGVFVIQTKGPVNIMTRNYEFLVVSDPTKSFCIVLANDVQRFKVLFFKYNIIIIIIIIIISFLLSNSFFLYHSLEQLRIRCVDLDERKWI